MNEDIVINMKKYCHLYSREQTFPVKCNSLSLLLEIKRKMETQMTLSHFYEFDEHKWECSLQRRFSFRLSLRNT